MSNYMFALLCLEAEPTMAGMQVAQALERAKVEEESCQPVSAWMTGLSLQSCPGSIVMVNNIRLCFIPPRRAVENEFIESFNGGERRMSGRGVFRWWMRGRS